MLDLNNVEVHKLSPPHKKQVSHRNLTLIVHVQAMGMYLKVHHDGRKGNLQPTLLLKCDGTCKAMITKLNNNRSSLNI